MTETKIEIDGMSCGHCVSAVQQALAELPGVTVQQVTIGSATVRYDPAVTTPSDIADAIVDAGYTLADR